MIRLAILFVVTKSRLTDKVLLKVSIFDFYESYSAKFTKKFL